MSSAALAEVGQEGARGANQAVDIGLKHGLELFFRDFFYRAIQAVAGIVHEDIDVAEGGNGLLGDGFDLSRVGDVEGEGAGGGGVLMDQVFDLGDVAGGGDDAVAAAQKLLSEQTAEASGRSSDEPDAG